jgi:hypothetical protein
VLDAQWHNPAQAPLQQRIVAGVGIGHAVAMAESKRALADALEHDRIELSPGDQIHRRIEAISRESHAGAEAEMIALGHPASLARASSCNQTSLAIQSSMVCTEQARSLTFHEIEPIVMVSPQIGGGEGMLGGDLQRAEEGSSYCVQRSWRL